VYIVHFKKVVLFLRYSD